MDDRFCRDCRHYNDVGMLCTRGKQPSGKNLVTGDQEYKYKVLRLASTERESWMPWACGKRGMHFEKANAEITGADRRPVDGRVRGMFQLGEELWLKKW